MQIACRRHARVSLPPALLRVPGRAAAALVVVALSGARPACAQTAAAADGVRADRVLRGLRPTVEVAGRPPVRWTVAERMAHYRVPGVSIAVVEGGRVAWARGVGVKAAGAAAARDSVTPATLFQAASISKPVTATAMLRLVERGALALDTNVNAYLTTWKVPDDTFPTSAKVTLRRLVSHTAGLTVHGFPGYAAGAPVPTVVQVLDGAAPANTEPVRVDVAPGTLARYSGGGTVVLQQLLEDVTRKPFPALMQELVLAPAGMTRSTFAQPLPADRAHDAARAHDGQGRALAGGWHTYPEMAPAGLWTTPADLARWALAVSDARAGRTRGGAARSTPALLSRATATEMLTPQTASVRKAPGMPGDVGLGPFLAGRGRTFRFGHGGVNEGFVSDLTMYPELSTGAVVMANGDGAHLLLREIQLALAAEYGWPEPAPRRVTVATLAPGRAAGLAGRYTLKVGPGVPAEVVMDGPRLVLRAPQLPPDEELLPASDTSFVTSTLGWRVNFTRGAAGRATRLTVTRDAGPPVVGERVR